MRKERNLGDLIDMEN